MAGKTIDMSRIKQLAQNKQGQDERVCTDGRTGFPGHRRTAETGRPGS